MTTEMPLPTRLPLDGVFEVDETCIDCHLCQDLAPDNFDGDDDREIHVCFKQPDCEDELEAVLDALDSCPTDSIHYLASEERG